MAWCVGLSIFTDVFYRSGLAFIDIYRCSHGLIQRSWLWNDQKVFTGDIPGSIWRRRSRGGQNASTGVILGWFVVGSLTCSKWSFWCLLGRFGDSVIKVSKMEVLGVSGSIWWLGRGSGQNKLREGHLEWFWRHVVEVCQMIILVVCWIDLGTDPRSA